MKKLSKKSRYLSAALLASCALSALDGTSIYAAATVAADENPLGVNQVTIRTDRNNLTVQRIGAQVTIENQYLGDEGLANLLQHLPANITSLRIYALARYMPFRH